VLVGAEHTFPPGQTADQHEQSRLRQMEVGQHRLDCFEFETWIDEKVSSSGTGDDGSCAEAHGVFQSSNGGGADSDDAPRGAESLVDSGCGAGRNRVGLGMDLVIFHALDAYWLECAKADVQCDLGAFNAALMNAVEDFWSEVKAGCGGGD